MLFIDETKLELLIEKHRNLIGYEKFEFIEPIASGLLFFMTNLIADYSDFGIWKYIIKTICLILGLFLVVHGVIVLYYSQVKKYNSTKLLSEIKALDNKIHEFSIVALQDTFNEYPSKYLLYYDVRWECWLFFSFRTANIDNDEHLKNELSNKINIPKELINLEYKMEDTHIKYSVSDKVYKCYQHRIYFASLSHFPDGLKSDTFEIAGTKFKWFSFNEMYANSNSKNKNSDIIELVRQNA